MAAELNELLQNLGLTEYEAKTLSTLFALRETEAPAISRTAQVPKTRVYDVLEKLVKRGLVIEIYGRPKKYRVIDAKDALSQLIAQKKEEITHFEQKAKRIQENLDALSAKPENGGEKVMKVKDKNDFLKILAQEIDSAKNEVLALTRLDENHEALKTALHGALGRKVSVKMISRVPKTIAEDVKKLAKRGANLRDHDHGVNAYVIDGHKVVLALSDFSRHRPEYHFTIWDHNRPMATALSRYFDHCWTKGKSV